MIVFIPYIMQKCKDVHKNGLHPDDYNSHKIH